MTDNNLPGGEPGTVDAPAPTYDEQVAGIADILDDPAEPEPVEEDRSDVSAEADEDGSDEPEIDLSEDVEQDGGEQPDGPQDYASGRFAADNAKVKLEDGTVISVADLKRNNLFQRDYTKKTTEHAEAVKAFDAKRSEVDQQAQSLTQLAEYLDWYSQNYLPQQPPQFEGTPETDPIGYLQHSQKLQQFQQAQGLRNYFNAERQKFQQAAQQKAQAEARAAFESEMQNLVANDPNVGANDPKFWSDNDRVKQMTETLVADGAKWWGLTKDDLSALTTAKHWRIVRDAVRYRQALGKASQVRKEVQQKPVMSKGGRRADPRARGNADRQARSEQLRKSGSFEAGVASLMDLDL